MKVKKATAGILSLLMIFALLAGIMIQGYAAGGAANTYTVTFYEYNNMVDEVTVNAGETVAAADIPATDTGRYWAVGFDKTAIFDENYVVNSDLEVYSYQGTVTTTYTVTFYEYNNKVGEATVTAGGTVAAADIPAADTGRYWAVGFDKTAIFDENYVVNSDLEIYSYKAATYTVTFYEYNNMVDEVTVTAGETVAAADIPAADTGRHWCVGTDKTALFDETYAVTSDIEVYSYAHDTTAAAVIENEVAATCTTAGSYDSVVYCAVCGEEVSRVTETIAATGHTAGEAVKENVVEATETKSGSYDEVVYCTVCGGEISRKTVTVPATGSSTTPTSAPTETPAGTTAPTETPAGTTAPTDAPTVTVSPTVSPADGTETTATPPAAPDGNTVTVTPKPADETSPKTGDGSDLGLWIGLVVLCGFGAAAAIGTMRKKSK